MRSAPNTTETDVDAVVAWEPCLEFAADPTEPGVCAGCGWLEDDHAHEAPLAA